MNRNSKHRLLAACALAAIFAADAGFSAARADEQTVKLIKLLIQKGILTNSQAGELLRETGGAATSRTKHGAAPVQAAPEAEPAAAPSTGGIRVTYVPQFIRRQIADQVRSEVMAQTKEEGWAEPDALPEWTKRFKLYGDMRARYERDSFDHNNYNDFFNFTSINSGSGYDAQNLGSGSYSQASPPFLNTTQDRDRARIRARLGVLAYIDDGLTADFRLSTGSDQGPVTPNQTLGQPGDFSKFAAYIDRANLTYTGIPGLTASIGRFANPFSTTDLIFYSELGFDGLAAHYQHDITDTTGGFITAGVFPILNSAFDFSTNSDQKFNSDNGYMLAVQGGGEWRVRHDLTAKLAVGLFDFTGIQGAVSQPCEPPVGTNAPYICDTDNTRLLFQQFGNTVYAIRSIVNTPGVTYQVNPQYYGLASRFAVLEAHPQFLISSYDPFDILLEGEYLKNLAYNRNAILDHGPVQGPIGPANNLIGKNDYYQGGDTAWMVKGTFGNLAIHKRWDWNVTAGYKYLETDSTLDSINDADFHLGGTNAQGTLLTGSLGVAKETFLSLRWFSAQTISGPHYGNTVVQLDLQSSF
jgi:hypothetical protein